MRESVRNSHEWKESRSTVLYCVALVEPEGQ